MEVRNAAVYSNRHGGPSSSGAYRDDAPKAQRKR